MNSQRLDRGREQFRAILAFLAVILPRRFAGDGLPLLDRRLVQVVDLRACLEVDIGDRAYWFMLEPLLMSKQIFDALPKDQQVVIMAAGAAQEKFALDSARADDKAVADVYIKAGAKVYDLDEATVRKWQAIARETAWKDYGEKSESCAKLLAAAIKTL